MTTHGDDQALITGEDEAQTAVNAMNALLDRMDKRDPNEPGRTTLVLDEDGHVAEIKGETED